MLSSIIFPSQKRKTKLSPTENIFKKSQKKRREGRKKGGNGRKEGGRGKEKKGKKKKVKEGKGKGKAKEKGTIFLAPKTAGMSYSFSCGHSE